MRPPAASEPLPAAASSQQQSSTSVACASSYEAGRSQSKLEQSFSSQAHVLGQMGSSEEAGARPSPLCRQTTAKLELAMSRRRESTKTAMKERPATARGWSGSSTAAPRGRLQAAGKKVADAGALTAALGADASSTPALIGCPRQRAGRDGAKALDSASGCSPTAPAEAVTDGVAPAGAERMRRVSALPAARPLPRHAPQCSPTQPASSSATESAAVAGLGLTAGAASQVQDGAIFQHEVCDEATFDADVP